MEELVFAIPAVKLWNLISYKEKGLIEETGEVLKNVVQNGLFHKRNDLEEDPAFKQIIPYGVISNEESFYLFNRSTRQIEDRLHNKLSLGVGGHMNPGNSKELNEQYLVDELIRELFEEVRLFNECFIEAIEFIGFINDDSIPVGSVHIGLLFNIHISNKNVVINETDKMTGDWIDKTDLTEYYEGMETWSQIIFDYFIR